MGNSWTGSTFGSFDLAYRSVVIILVQNISAGFLMFHDVKYSYLPLNTQYEKDAYLTESCIVLQIDMSMFIMTGSESSVAVLWYASIIDLQASTLMDSF